MLKVRDLSVHYGKIRAVRNIDMDIEKGEIVSLIGANGAGKSTTLRALSGLTKPAGGSIEFEGRSITGWSAKAIVEAGLSHCPEGRQIFPRMSVMENLELGAYTRKDKKNLQPEYDRIFEYFPVLAQRRTQLGGTLSGGEQQMLAIGRALMSKPKLLLLDEPSLGLAPLLVEKIFEIIQSINREGMTVLLIEQNAWQALNIAHRGYVLETGSVSVCGVAADLLHNDHVRKAYLGE
ncbi:MAG TPA: ABC transporter ATP-binding protein [Negativicutes bacterium]|nr:ABC transporter ATP-binding protein [Negativicutes bacterium]